MDQLPTPCLLVSFPALEQNEPVMHAMVRDNNIALRPHCKGRNFKSSQLTAWYIGRSKGDLAGFCTQTIAEAEVLVRGGANDILITDTLPPQAAMALASLATSCPPVSHIRDSCRLQCARGRS